MSVTSACVGIPAPLPTSTMLCARETASSKDCMTAPLPHFTSRTKWSKPAHTFGHDGCRDQPQMLDGGGHIAGRVHPPVGWRQIVRLSDNGESAFCTTR